MQRAHPSSRILPASLLIGCGLALGCESVPVDPVAEAPPLAWAAETTPYRGHAVIVRLVREAAERHRVPNDVLLALGWSESRFASDRARYDADDDDLELGPPCGSFGLDRGAVRDAAAASVGARPEELCHQPELEVEAAALRLRALAGGDAAPALDDTHAWLDALDGWHPALVGDALDYGDYVTRVMHLGFRGEDARGDAIVLPPTALIEGFVAYPGSDDASAVAEAERVASDRSDGVGVALGYDRPDSPDATWAGPSCDYTAGRSAAVEYVVIHTCEGGFAGCYATLKNCTTPEVSAHYVVSLAGEARQVVEERDTAWHVGCLNGRSVGIEHEGFAGSNPDREAMYRTSARIVASICRRHGIPCDRTHVIGHGEANARFCGGDHWDPGPNWDWTRFMSLVAEGVCSPSTEVCNGRDDDCDGSIDEGDVCEVELLQAQAAAYAPPTSTDIDGDGRSDLCARGYSGFRCWPANADATYGAMTNSVPWSNASGWDDVDNYATIRMGDLDGDGRADVCARSNSGVSCALSTGSGFADESVWSDVPSDANGWNSPGQYTTLRLADVDGDGRDDLCGRGAAGVDCWLSNGTRFDRHVEGPRWSNDSGWNSPRYYGTLRMGDVNGDGKADVCARAAAGALCYLSDGEGFPTRIDGPEWSNDLGFGEAPYWSTMRLADVNGDGKADLCIRTGTDLRCHLSTGAGFEGAVIVAGLSDASGWNDLTNYGTLRAADVDGDGAEDLCLRSNSQIDCWAYRGGTFGSIAGPAWSDESGWSAAQHYTTIRLADANGDGMADVCARAEAGWRCHLATGTGFGDAVAFAELTNEGGWSEPHYYRTIQMAGVGCRASEERCNGVDDDCDGEIDEGLECGAPTDAAVPPGVDAGLVGGDASPRRDAGGEVTSGGLSGDCSCRVAGTRSELPGGALLGMLFGLALALRRRRQRSAAC